MEAGADRASTLEIADLRFDVESAVLDAFVADHALRWGVQITGTPLQPEYREWRPSLTAESLLSTGPGQIGELSDLANRTIQWREPLDEEGEPRGTLYVFEHLPTYDTIVRLVATPTGVGVEWDGVCDVHYDERYASGLRLRAHAPLLFRGVWCGRSTEAHSYDLVRQFFPLDSLRYSVTDHGVSLMQPRC